jgi:hypothetical protein
MTNSIVFLFARLQLDEPQVLGNSKLNVWEYTHADNGGAVHDWKVFSLDPPLQGAEAFRNQQSAIKNRKSQTRNRHGIFSTTRHHRHYGG